VPLLGDIPFIGGLFRSDNRTRSKSNLMVFLKPVVIRTQDAATSLTLDRYDSIRAQQKEAQPEPSRVMQINEAPVMPPLRPPPGAASGPNALPPPSSAPLAPPQTPASAATN
jgi:general secretion pathway protein D